MNRLGLGLRILVDIFVCASDEMFNLTGAKLWMYRARRQAESSRLDCLGRKRFSTFVTFRSM